MAKKVNVSFRIDVRGMIGGSFEMSKSDFDRLMKKYEGGRRSSHAETDLADELLGLAPLNYFDHLNVDEMEITEFEEESK